MDFESVADELFASQREEFTALRDERARQARPDRELAARVARLRKPTVAAWLVNQVSRAYPEEIDHLTELGESLRKAHQNLAGPELRALSRQRHELVDLLNRRAQWLARKAGYGFGDTTGRQIDETFEAAVADARAAEAVRAARLSAALAPGASEDWLTAATVPVRSPRKTVPKAKPAAKPKQAPAKRAALEQERKEAVRERDRAQQALTKAEQAADKATIAVAELRGRLADAIQLERDKRAQVATARKAFNAAERAAKRLE